MGESVTELAFDGGAVDSWRLLGIREILHPVRTHHKSGQDGSRIAKDANKEEHKQSRNLAGELGAPVDPLDVRRILRLADFDLSAEPFKLLETQKLIPGFTVLERAVKGVW